MRKLSVLFLSLTLLSSAVFTGCGAKENQTDKESTNIQSDSNQTSDNSTNTSRTDLTVIIPDDFTTLDPQKLPSAAEMNFCANIFDTLVVMNENNVAEPYLAETWEVSEDGLTYTFHLKEGVKFQNGQEMTAKDVAFSADRFMEEEWMAFASFMLESADAVDAHTVTFTLKYPYSAFLSELEYLFIVSEDYYNSVTPEEFARKPIGTGAYQFVQWDAAQKIVLTANENYWGESPAIKDITFKIIPDTNTAFVAMEAGEADFYFKATALDVAQAEKEAGLETDQCTSNNFTYVNFNSEKITKEVRQALSYAVDRETINIMVNEGTGILGNIPLTETQEGYTSDLTTYEYNPEKAKELLKAAGAEGITLDFFYGESATNTKLGQALQSMFNAVGVTLNLTPVESGTWWAEFEDGNYTVSRGGYPMEMFNTDAPYFDMYHSTGSFNVSRINNSEIDALLEEARTESDSEKRDEIYKKVNQICADEAYFIPLYFSRSSIIYKTGLQGVKAVPVEKYRYAEFYWN